MGATWDNAELGRFVFQKGEWARRVKAPGFDLFSYEPAFVDPLYVAGEYPLAFAAEGEGEVPTAGMVAVAMKVLEDPERLARRVARALWKDFNGEGPGSGMWWSDSLDEVEVFLAEAGLPGELREEEQVLGALRLWGIVVYRDFDTYARPVAHLFFHAAFEQDHGVGVLTNGVKIKGLGYGTDVQLFEEE